MKITVEINDVLPDYVESCIEQFKNFILNYLESEQPDTCPEFSDLDHNGAVHEIVDGWVPIYTKQIDDIWYLHKEDLIHAYQNAGVGDNPLENNGMAAIYYYLHNELCGYFDHNVEEIFKDWLEKKGEL
jgi:hypothetical protein